jgi:hypothetical protein
MKTLDHRSYVIIDAVDAIGRRVRDSGGEVPDGDAPRKTQSFGKSDAAMKDATIRRPPLGSVRSIEVERLLSVIPHPPREADVKDTLAQFAYSRRS